MIQAPFARIVPFIAGGVGATVLRGVNALRGVSVGPVVALGARVMLDERVGARVDLRDRMLPSRSGSSLAHTLELAFSVFARFGSSARPTIVEPSDPASSGDSSTPCIAEPHVAGPALSDAAAAEPSSDVPAVPAVLTTPEVPAEPAHAAPVDEPPAAPEADARSQPQAPSEGAPTLLTQPAPPQQLQDAVAPTPAEGVPAP